MKKVILIVSLIIVSSLLLYHFILYPKVTVANNQVIDKKLINDKLGVSLGDVNAPVKITIYSDYGCSACRQLNEEFNQIELKERYLEKGIIQIIYKDVPADGHLNAYDASLAALSAENQGEFFKMSQLLYGNSEWYKNKEVIFEYAKQLKLDLSKFKKDLNSNETKERIESSVEEYNKLGLLGTPVIIINNKQYLGSPESKEKLEELIQQAINGANTAN
ncbi:hypothetical protein BCJMU51_0917 [Bacillus cereus]|uniref:DsbA family protein n=1 Tax=Bacillus TaxID=1386 RepID=UPI0007A003C4|nr:MULTISPECIES: thioredoxin domain-containing protein [Bacillus]KYZ64956.1 hypothetical protein A3782_08115 [Bacillus sp. GZT]MCU5326264.1 DsbA family protein [Bacillus cereus]MCU5718699.1 DsbA family protein [Bacillus cereus]MDA1845247.1 thioredoxin domain-containing protein [Bacillus cereus]BCB36047.1 hypothetical protein BCM0045_0942 [Bacillus cereus]